MQYYFSAPPAALETELIHREAWTHCTHTNPFMRFVKLHTCQINDVEDDTYRPTYYNLIFIDRLILTMFKPQRQLGFIRRPPYHVSYALKRTLHGSLVCADHTSKFLIIFQYHFGECVL